MEENDDVFSGALKKWHNLQSLNPYSPLTPQSSAKLWSMVVVKDSSPTKSADEGLSVFPPCNHENLAPSQFNLEPKAHSPPPSFPSTPLSFLPPDSDPSPSPVVTPFAKWWALTAQILRPGIANIVSYFGSDGNRKSFWSFRNVALTVTVVLWWIYARARRQQRKRKSVEHLMQIITQKDEKIMQLLSQIAKMNEVLLTRHKALASKLSN